MPASASCPRPSRDRNGDGSGRGFPLSRAGPAGRPAPRATGLPGTFPPRPALNPFPPSVQIVAAILAIAGIVMMTYADGFHSHSVIGIALVVGSASTSALYKVGQGAGPARPAPLPEERGSPAGAWRTRRPPHVRRSSASPAELSRSGRRRRHSGQQAVPWAGRRVDGLAMWRGLERGPRPARAAPRSDVRRGLSFRSSAARLSRRPARGVNPRAWPVAPRGRLHGGTATLSRGLKHF